MKLRYVKFYNKKVYHVLPSTLPGQKRVLCGRKISHADSYLVRAKEGHTVCKSCLKLQNVR